MDTCLSLTWLAVVLPVESSTKTSDYPLLFFSKSLRGRPRILSLCIILVTFFPALLIFSKWWSVVKKLSMDPLLHSGTKFLPRLLTTDSPTANPLSSLVYFPWYKLNFMRSSTREQMHHNLYPNQTNTPRKNFLECADQNVVTWPHRLHKVIRDGLPPV